MIDELVSTEPRYAKAFSDMKSIRVAVDQELVDEYDLHALKEVQKVNFVSRLLKSLNYLIWGDV